MKIFVISNGECLKKKIGSLVDKDNNISVTYLTSDIKNNNIFGNIEPNERAICLFDKTLVKSSLLAYSNIMPNNCELIILNANDDKFIKFVIDSLKKYHSDQSIKENKLYIKTFGQFDVFNNDKLVDFKRSKSKEILAILVDNKGSIVPTKYIADLIFEDGKYDRDRQKALHVYISDLRKTLKDLGHDDVVIKSKLGYSIDTKAFDCDYYDVLKGNNKVALTYDGRYMYQYHWSDTTNSYIDRLLSEKEDSSLNKGTGSQISYNYI